MCVGASVQSTAGSRGVSISGSNAGYTMFRGSVKSTGNPLHLNRQEGGRQFSRLLAAEVWASAVVMLDTPCSEVVWRVLATHSICQFPLHFPSHALPCAITFQLDPTTQEYWLVFCIIDVNPVSVFLTRWNPSRTADFSDRPSKWSGKCTNEPSNEETRRQNPSPPHIQAHSGEQV